MTHSPITKLTLEKCTFWPRRWSNWFQVPFGVMDLQVGMTLLSGHGLDETAGNYVVSDIQQMDADTVHIVMRRV